MNSMDTPTQTKQNFTTIVRTLNVPHSQRNIKIFKYKEQFWIKFTFSLTKTFPWAPLSSHHYIPNYSVSYANSYMSKKRLWALHS